jgi:hypothetical protein
MITKADLLGAAGPGAEKLKAEREKQEAEMKNIIRCFLRCLGGDEGAVVLNYLERCGQSGFPDYNNPNKTYAQAGKQELVKHIRAVISMAQKQKQEGK